MNMLAPMNADKGELDSRFNARMLRATLGLGLAGTFLTGLWVAPAWIFAASVMAVYLVTTAILDKGVMDAVPGSAKGRSQEPAYEHNVPHVGRVARGAAAGAALSGVLGDALIDAYVLDAFGIFALNVLGIYLTMTAIIAWDPVNALFRSGAVPMGVRAATAPAGRSMADTGPVFGPRTAGAKRVA